MDSAYDVAYIRKKNSKGFILVLCLAGLLINYLLAHLATGLKLPLFLDNIGSALAAALGGYIPAIIVGFFTNIVNGINDLANITIYYGSLTVLIAIASAWFAGRDFYNLRKPWRLLAVIVTFALIGGGMGSILTWALFGFSFGTGISAPLAMKIYESGVLSQFWSQFTADMLIDLADKSITVVVIAVVLAVLPASLKEKFYYSGWMQNPVGTTFNPDTVRSEMASAQAFWEVISNPVAVSKFFHSVTSGWVTGGVFVVAVSGWYLLKGRETQFAKKSMLIGAIVGLVGSAAVMLSGDSSGVHAAEFQPMKLAAAEGLENGGRRAPFSIVPGVKIPGMLSILATHDLDGFVPGINDILNGYTDNDGNVIPSVEEKMEKGRKALDALAVYRELRESDPDSASVARAILDGNVQYLWFVWKDKLENKRWFFIAALCCIPLVYICGQCGWIVAEVGRQPWTIQGLLPVNVAISSLSAGAVKTTFFLFLAIFALFLFIEIRIMLGAIRKGPQITED